MTAVRSHFSAHTPLKAVPRMHRRLLSCWLALSLPCVSQAAGPVFKVMPDTVWADSGGVWRAGLVVENPAEWGLYADSLFLDWRSSDADASAAPRSGTTSLQALVSVIAPAGARESTGLDWNAPADFERGTLTFRLYLHDAKQQVHALSATAVVAGNALYDRHPAESLDVGGQKVEVVHLAAHEDKRPAGGVLYVPPSGVSARGTLRWAQLLVNRGYAVSILSLPGSGRSSGGADRAGPASVAAVEAALARLAHEPGVDAKRLAVWGLGDGASTALLVAARHPELQAVVAQDASHDPWASYRALAAPGREAYVREAGRDSAGWKARSPLAVAARITAPVLVLQTSDSSAPDVAAAEAFAAVRAGKQLAVETRIGAREQRPFRRNEAVRVALDFLARRLRRP